MKQPNFVGNENWAIMFAMRRGFTPGCVVTSPEKLHYDVLSDVNMSNDHLFVHVRPAGMCDAVLRDVTIDMNTNVVSWGVQAI